MCAHFLTNRLNRIGNHKLHHQSPYPLDYADLKIPRYYSNEQLFSAARQLGLIRAKTVKVYRQMVFNMAAAITVTTGKLITNFTKEAEAIIQQVVDIANQWESYARNAQVPAGLTQEIQSNLRLDL